MKIIFRIKDRKEKIRELEKKLNALALKKTRLTTQRESLDALIGTISKAEVSMVGSIQAYH